MDLEKAADDLARWMTIAQDEDDYYCVSMPTAYSEKSNAENARNSFRDHIHCALLNAFKDGRNASAQETRTASTTGWICPVCGRGVNPAFPSCQCVKAKEATP